MMSNFVLSLVFVVLVFPDGSTSIPYDFQERHMNIENTCQEGQSSDINHRIVGGRCARHGEFPYMLSLQYNGVHFCGANLVLDHASGKQFAITAAHCVDADTTSGIALMAGSVTLSGQSEWKQVLSATKIVVHPNFYYTAVGSPVNDIAVIFFTGDFINGEYVRPIALPTSDNFDESYLGNVDVSGWGLLGEGAESSDHLMTVEVPLVDRFTCAELYSVVSDSEVIFDTNLCAGDLNGGKDSCQGDSGGPLAIEITNEDSAEESVLIGITSFGKGCARPSLPGVYVRVSSFTAWINETAQENLD